MELIAPTRQELEQLFPGVDALTAQRFIRYLEDIRLESSLSNNALIDARLSAMDGQLETLRNEIKRRPVFRGDFESGQWYRPNDIVYDQGWLMYCVNRTQERAAGLPDGVAETTLTNTPGFVTQNNVSQVSSGNTYTFSRAGWVRRIRVWVPTVAGTINYRILVTDVSDPLFPIQRIYPLPALTANTWSDVSIGQFIVVAGTSLQIELEALNSATSVTFTGGWTSRNASNATPVTSQWTRNSGNNRLRFDDQDLALTDRSAELLTVIAGTVITITQDSDLSRFREFIANEPATDQGSYVEIDNVSQTETGPGGTPQNNEPCTCEFVVPTAAPTEYSENNGYWANPANQPGFVNVQGFLRFGSPINIPGSFQNSYGTDLEFQPGAVSEDWSFMALSGEF